MVQNYVVDTGAAGPHAALPAFPRLAVRVHAALGALKQHMDAFWTRRTIREAQLYIDFQQRKATGACAAPLCIGGRDENQADPKEMARNSTERHRVTFRPVSPRGKRGR